MRLALVVIAVLVAVALGVAGVVLGEADDSPGLQGLGVLLAVGAIALGARGVHRARQPPVHRAGWEPPVRDLIGGFATHRGGLRPELGCTRLSGGISTARTVG